MLNVSDNEILLFKHEVEEYNKIESEIKNLKLKMKPIQDRIKELLNIKKEKQTEVLSFMEKNDLDVCNTNSGTIELKNTTHVKAIKKADVYDRLFKFFSRRINIRLGSVDKKKNFKLFIDSLTEKKNFNSERSNFSKNYCLKKFNRFSEELGITSTKTKFFGLMDFLYTITLFHLH